MAHYRSKGSWLPEGIVLREAGNLAGISGVIGQGSLDPGNLLGTPWLLARAWPDCELLIVDEAGHSTAGSGVAEALVAATDRFAR